MKPYRNKRVSAGLNTTPTRLPGTIPGAMPTALGRHATPATLRGRLCRGFTLVEVMFAMMIFTMMLLIFGAVFPFALRTAEFSNNYSQAALLAQHKIDELQTAGFARLDATNLASLGIIDATPNTSPYSFTTVDNLVGGGANHGYFPVGSTGTITIVDYHTLNSSIPAGKMDYVTINIRWTSYTGNIGTYAASSIL